MYNKYFEINKNFQSSINLELDLGNESKIYEYIPTTDICDVLKKYIKAVLGKTKEKATTLVGPYGKGKSFLLLVLSYILSNNKETECWHDLAERIKKVDIELFDLMMEIKEKNLTLITLIINSNYENLNQSFMISLNEGLKKHKIEKLIPRNAFSLALKEMSKWKEDKETSKDLKKLCESMSGTTYDEIETGLKQYSKESYDIFCKLYYCIHRGVPFNPFINSDIVKIYTDVTYQLKSYGYSGLFIIFDEFSKFIESSSVDVSKGLKIIQDFAEKCTRSGKSDQLHLCCVTHKNISLYKTDKTDSFKAIEGRFTEVRFNRSLEENYQIISSAIIKKKGAKEIAETYFKDNNRNFYKEIEKLKIFNSEKNFYKSLFPLNPLTSFSLIQLSELAAQNERTLYTFLSDTDINSFNYFIQNNDIKDGLFNVDKIYDYFSSLFQNEERNYIKNIWYRAESISSKLDSAFDKKIIKTLAIILMINNVDKLPPTEQIVALCLQKTLEETEKEIKNLLASHYLRKSNLNNLLSFALSNTKYIDERIAILSKTKFKDLDEALLANKLNDNRFILPRKHNEERKITRFFKVIYISEESFVNLSNFDIFFEKNFCDGVVLNLLRYSLSKEQILNKVKKVNNQRIVVCFPNEIISPIFRDELIRFTCLNDILQFETNLDDVSKEEINLLLDEASDNIKELFSAYFDNKSKVAYVNSKYKDTNISSLLSKILDNYFPKKLIFNNELVNKHELSKQYRKAVNNIIDLVLNNETTDLSPTSPEGFTRKSILESNEKEADFREVIDSIKSTILGLEGKKENFTALFSYLEAAPYGIRKGVIPILLSKAISELSNNKTNIILYYEKKEIILNADNLVKAIGKDSYYLSSTKGSIEQKKYIGSLMKQFDVKSTNSSRLDIINLTNSIKKYFMGLPNFIRSCNSNEHFMIYKPVLEIKNLFLEININPNEALFNRPLKILETKSYAKVANFFKELPEKIETSFTTYKKVLINIIKNNYSLSESTSLKSGLSGFIKKHVKKTEKILLDGVNKSIEDTIVNVINYDDFQALDELSKASLGITIEDWDKDNSDQLFSILDKFKLNIINSERINISATGLNKMLQEQNIHFEGIPALLNNNIESIIEEFSDSVSNEDKVKVLTNILKKYI